MTEGARHVVIDYTNYRGERRLRAILPLGIMYDSNEWHPEAQWMLTALDVEKEEVRTFAMANIHGWHPGGYHG